MLKPLKNTGPIECDTLIAGDRIFEDREFQRERINTKANTAITETKPIMIIQSIDTGEPGRRVEGEGMGVGMGGGEGIAVGAGSTVIESVEISSAPWSSFTVSFTV